MLRRNPGGEGSSSGRTCWSQRARLRAGSAPSGHCSLRSAGFGSVGWVRHTVRACKRERGLEGLDAKQMVNICSFAWVMWAPSGCDALLNGDLAVNGEPAHLCFHTLSGNAVLGSCSQTPGVRTTWYSGKWVRPLSEDHPASHEMYFH